MAEDTKPRHLYRIRRKFGSDAFSAILAYPERLHLSLDSDWDYVLRTQEQLDEREIDGDVTNISHMDFVRGDKEVTSSYYVYKADFLGFEYLGVEKEGEEALQ